MIQVMERLTVEEDGTVKVPARLLGEQGFSPGTELIAESAGGGLVFLHRPDRYEIEIYTDERLAEFAEEDRMDPETAERLHRVLERRRQTAAERGRSLTPTSYCRRASGQAGRRAGCSRSGAAAAAGC